MIYVYQTVFDIFLGFFGNIFNMVMVLIFLLVGVILGIFLRPGWGNHVMKVLPREHRFIDIPVKQETAVSVECEDKKGMAPHRFVKLAPGFVGTVGRFVKRQATRYIGKEGTAYTWFLQAGKYVKLGSLADGIRHVWGTEFYNTIPTDERGKLENSQVLVTVDLTDGLTPEDYPSCSEEDIKREEDREAARTLWQGKQRQEKGALISMLIVGIAGFGIACLLMILGILRIPTYVQPQPATTAQLIISLVAGVHG